MHLDKFAAEIVT